LQPELTTDPSRRFSLSVWIFAALCVCGAMAGLLLEGCGKKPKTQETAETMAPAAPEFQDLVVFASSGQLVVTNLAGDPAQSLLLPEKNLWFPAVAPDNSCVAYWSKASGVYELWVYDLAARRPSQVTFFNDSRLPPDFQNFNLHNAPAWSPDNRTLAFSRMGKIWTVERNGFNLETLLSDGVRYAPSWSPSGDQLAYVAIEGATHNLFIWHRTHRLETRLTNFPAGSQVGSPAWSPDGSQIAFTLASGERVDIWVIHPDGGGLKRMTKDGYSNAPAWSPDSTRLVFSSGRQDPYHWDIWMMNRDGSRQFSITRNGGFSPAWLRLPYQAAVRLQTKNEPMAAATAVPTAAPKIAPAAATAEPVQPAAMATAPPTLAPTPAAAKAQPTLQPTPKAAKATPQPTAAKTVAATKAPTQAPTLVPTQAPTQAPTAKPTPAPATPAPEEAATPAAIPTAAESGGNYEAYEEYANEDDEVLPEDDLTMESQGNEVTFRAQLDFFFAKDMLKADSVANLKRLAEQLEKYPDAALVVSCRASGPKWLRSLLPLLKSLSRARANAVLQHLIVVEKIPQINVSAIGEGDPFPDLGLENKRLVRVKVE